MAELDAGRSVPFGAVVVTRDGLEKLRIQGNLRLPWSEIVGIRLDRKRVVLDLRGKWLPCDLGASGEIPNLALLFVLVQSITGKVGGRVGS